MKYGYFATIKQEENGFVGSFVDFEHEKISENSYQKTIAKLQTILSDRLLFVEDDQLELPKSSELAQIRVKNGEYLTYIQVDTSISKAHDQLQLIKKNLTIPKYLNEMGKKAKINFSQLLTDALASTLLSWTENGIRKKRRYGEIKRAKNIVVKNIEFDETLSEEKLSFHTWPGVTEHLVIKKRNSKGEIYYVFRHISGKTVMNWVPNDYLLAEEQVFIGDIPIVMELPNEPSQKFSQISESYRYD